MGGKRTRHTIIPVSSKDIVKGFFIEKRKRGSGIYPFDSLEVGDAFFTVNKSISGSASAYAKESGKKFQTMAWIKEEPGENNEIVKTEGFMCGRVS